MRDFFVNLFSRACGPEITLFSIWHIMYIVLICGLTIGGVFLFRNKSDKTKNIVLSVLAYIVIGVYIADFFIMPLSRGDVDVDKLPFHICTLLSFFVGFAQFNKKFECVREPIAVLAIVSSLMYITYPGSALGGVTVFSYKVVQTFVYHGLLFSWGCLSVGLKVTTFKWKNIWKALVGLCLIAVWAAFGNCTYSSADHHYDWFFITGSTFPFIPSWLMPFVVVTAIFGMVALIYLINWGVNKIVEKIAAKKQAKLTHNEEVSKQ